MAEHVQVPTILRGLEVLETITEQANLLTVLRFFLRSGVPQIESKCVLMLGRRCPSPDWMKQIMSEGNDRVRANLIESLWGRMEPEDIKAILQDALKDDNHRVAANAAYGLFLCGHEEHIPGIDRLVSSPKPEYRRAGIWVIKSIKGDEALIRIKPLIRDEDASVRRAAFAAIVSLREQATRP
jgi:HEAT repeat protein